MASEKNDKRRVRTFSASDKDVAMLEAVARYHGLNKSAAIVSLIKKEFWRVFPAGTDRVKPDRGAKVESK
ncbi:MAG TPA: hypothetical protein VKM94_17175 [Blastocatellia bacterium]|nr:hypothetical protein [Blastocatellia bacterium]